MINFKVLVLQLMPTFLRSGVLRAWLMSVATSLQKGFNMIHDCYDNQRNVVQWTSERKAMRERLNLLFLNKHYPDGESPDPLLNEYIEILDYVDVESLMMFNNEDIEIKREIEYEDLVILADTERGDEATITWNIEDRSLGCDLRVVTPTSKNEDGTFTPLVSEIQKLRNETNRLVFAGLLCKFYEARIINNNIIYKEYETIYLS